MYVVLIHTVTIHDAKQNLRRIEGTLRTPTHIAFRPCANFRHASSRRIWPISAIFLKSPECPCGGVGGARNRATRTSGAEGDMYTPTLINE